MAFFRGKQGVRVRALYSHKADKGELIRSEIIQRALYSAYPAAQA